MFQNKTNILLFLLYIGIWSSPRKSLTIITRAIDAVKLLTWISSHATAQQKSCAARYIKKLSYISIFTWNFAQHNIFSAITQKKLSNNFLYMMRNGIMWKWIMMINVNRCCPVLLFFLPQLLIPVYYRLILNNLFRKSSVEKEYGCENLVVNISDRNKIAIEIHRKYERAKK